MNSRRRAVEDLVLRMFVFRVVGFGSGFAIFEHLANLELSLLLPYHLAIACHPIFAVLCSRATS